MVMTRRKFEKTKICLTGYGVETRKAETQTKALYYILSHARKNKFKKVKQRLVNIGIKEADANTVLLALCFILEDEHTTMAALRYVDHDLKNQPFMEMEEL